MPTMVEIRHLGGIDLTSCKCLATGSTVGAEIDGMSMSLTRLSTRGFDAITFIFSMLHIATRIFISGSVGSAVAVTFYGTNSYQLSTNASGMSTFIGT